MSDSENIQLGGHENLGALVCPICHTPFSEEPKEKVGYCPNRSCHTPHHDKCWQFNGEKCGVFNCSGQGLLQDVYIISEKILSEVKLIELRQFIQKRDFEAALTIYFENREFFNNCREFSKRDRDNLAIELKKLRDLFSQKFSVELLRDDDYALTALAENYSKIVPLEELMLSPEQYRRLTQAQERVQVINKLNELIHAGDQTQIWKYYGANRKIIHSTREFYQSIEIQKAIKSASLFVAKQKYKSTPKIGNSAKLLELAHEVVSRGGEISFQEYQEIRELIERENILHIFKEAIESNNDLKITFWWSAYQDIVGEVSGEYDDRVKQARKNVSVLSELRLAITRKDFYRVAELFQQVDQRLLTPGDIYECQRMLNSAAKLNEFKNAYRRGDKPLMFSCLEKLDNETKAELPLVVMNKIEEIKKQEIMEQQLELLWIQKKYADFVYIYQSALNDGVMLSKHYSDKFFQAQLTMFDQHFQSKYLAD